MDGPVRSMTLDIVERRALGRNLYRVTIAANEKVRQPPDLDFDGLSTVNYERNPVVMWAHDAVGRSPSGGLPIGRTLSLARTSDGQLVAEFEFLGDDSFAQRVKTAWDKGFLRAASISWIPVESVPAEGGRWRDTRSELLEWSIVSIPADPDALRESHRLLLDSFLGDGVRGVGSGEFLDSTSLVSSMEPELALSADDYEDLTVALSLLREVVDDVEGRKGEGAEGEVSADDLAEIREMVGEIFSDISR